ncbi:MAG: hypothetical protein E7215_04305 [Clostridium sulfidigenes]|uniref:Uncharacterized protein n=1 Tax=Clostridium sulfidigenes TaxID=318464 RepID=A0A927W9X8_9CLOT|nr:hypothetical protein [Clostridium sulfidigenes]
MNLESELIILGNGTEWCSCSLNKLTSREKVRFFNERLPLKNRYILQIARLHYSYKLEKYIEIPGKTIWYKKFCKDLGLDANKHQILMIYDRNILGGEKSFIHYLRKHFPTIKLVYVFTNIVKYTGAKERDYVEKLNGWYDVVFAFDQLDAKKYGFNYSPLIYDSFEGSSDAENKQDLVFYVGQAKDRLKDLIKSFERLNEINIKTDFNIVKVTEPEMKYSDIIKYNKTMSYKDVIKKIKSSSCLIDIIQGESTGLTIKNCEAIVYQKKLITTNKSIKEYPFYDSRFIKVIESPDDITLDFFENNRNVVYKNSDYFSSDKFIERLVKALNE